MKNRGIMTRLLCGLALAALMLLPLSAAAAGDAAAVQTAHTLGILEQEQELGAVVTRAQLARMLVMASPDRDAVGESAVGGTLFRDVADHGETAAIIRLAVLRGWMSGYADGSFQPGRAVTLEEACAALLRLLGYDTAKLGGTYPAAQLNKAAELGLRRGVTAQQGQTITAGDGAQLFYNAFNAKTAGGQTYAASLGYPVTDGVLDAAAVVRASMKGPFVAAAEQTLPFAAQTVYVNGRLTENAALHENDVYYYNSSLKALWIYTKRTAGVVTALTPSAVDPTGVTVAGESYKIATSAASYQLSELSGGGLGQPVVLLLGMDNEVVGVLTEGQTRGVYYGVVQSSGRQLTTLDGADVMQSVRILCTDGVSRTFQADRLFSYPAGWLVQVTVDGKGVKITHLSGGSTLVSGRINSSATKLGDTPFAPDVKILDVGLEGSTAVVQPSRLAGYTLSPVHIGYCVLNDKGEIAHLLLNNATGDIWTYGCLVKVSEKPAGLGVAAAQEASAAERLMSLYEGVRRGTLFEELWQQVTGHRQSLVQKAVNYAAENTSGPVKSLLGAVAGGASYSFLVDGRGMSAVTDLRYPVFAGGMGIRYEADHSTVRSMIQLTPAEITGFGPGKVLTRTGSIPLAEDVQVYLWYMGDYYYTTLSAVNTEDHWLTAWHDAFGCPAGDLVRVIVAIRK